MNAELQRLIAQAAAGQITLTGRRPYRNSVDLTGQAFGGLAVIRRLPNHASGTQWLCRCSCGELLAVQGGNLRSGGSKSCGCSRQKTGSESLSWKGCGGLPGRHWAIIQSNAKRRGHTFNMTIEEGWALYEHQQGRCALTGWEIVLMAPVVKDVTASLDRIDSRAGYAANNTQWVHKDVNLSKNIHTQDYFIEMCRAIAANSSPAPTAFHNNPTENGEP
jgi:hypothetical protein